MKAYHLLHSHYQLELAKSELSQADVLVVGPEFPVELAYGATKTGAIVLPSINAGKLYLGGQDNEWWNLFRNRLNLPHRWSSPISDPQDHTPHELIRPTVENAFAYAELVSEALSSWPHGNPSRVYVDDSWKNKPLRILVAEKTEMVLGGDVTDPAVAFVMASAMWKSYLEVFFSVLRARGWSIWSNCNGDPLDDQVTVCCEYRGSTGHDAFVVDRALKRWGRTVLWFHPKQLELESIIIAGMKLPEEDQA